MPVERRDPSPGPAFKLQAGPVLILQLHPSPTLALPSESDLAGWKGLQVLVHALEVLDRDLGVELTSTLRA